MSSNTASNWLAPGGKIPTPKPCSTCASHAPTNVGILIGLKIDPHFQSHPSRFHGLTTEAHLAESPARSMVGSAGRLPKWPTGADCKSAGLRLRWFESITYHHLQFHFESRRLTD